MNEILNNLWLGDEWHANQAAEAGMIVICVLEERPEGEPDNAIHIPILKFDTQADKDLHNELYENMVHVRMTHGAWRVNMINLNIVCDAIEAAREMGRPVYVHCAAGIERSPLVVAWYLHTRYKKTLDEAYAMIQEKRSVVMDRRSFLPHPHNME